MTPLDPGNAPEPRAAHRSPFTRRRTLAAVAVLMGGTIGLTACAGHGAAASKAPAAGASAATAAPSTAPATARSTAAAQSTADGLQAQVDASVAQNVSAAKITITPPPGSTGASINSGTRVTVANGTLTSVTMTSTASGATVAGTISADRTSWTPNGQLARGTQYAISVAATDAQGHVSAANSTFATVSAANSFIGYFTPENGSTVGVGMPVSINFDKAVSYSDRAAVQRGVTVHSSSGQQVVGHWFSSTRLDLRPQNYWQAGSQVSLDLNLDGVQGAPGVFGVQHKTVSFTVGRSQVSTVDTRTDLMTVVRDGKVIRTIPVSAGSTAPVPAGTPLRSTSNGQMVISEKDPTTRMNGATVGFAKGSPGEYDIPDVPHAMRLSTSGTFIHGNYWAAPSVFGTANTSHGCVGLSDVKGGKDPNTPAAWFYDNSLVGDVVVVTNSPSATVRADNGLNGWNLSWTQWRAGSALG